ncbi:unnamed protein product [Cuscuta epithymum]|uniref:B box-type domain-containing protein n=1 Tax=Cuscuta epithymum TaxID=186058 RepID=A0AAV0DCJ1_9ASTE|nr:unnamed protein product [Cuscuta epithymum]
MDRGCELCGGEAAVCCPSDSAFLCWSCDVEVHGANSLVARHIRFAVCCNCRSITENRVSGGDRVSGFCNSCSASPPGDDGLDDALSSSSATNEGSSCRNEASSVENFARPERRNRGKPLRKVRSEAEGVLVKWCARLGIGGEERQEVARKARAAFQICSAAGRMAALPARISLAASLWFGWRRSARKLGQSGQGLKALEQITGVPSKLIVSAESKLQLVVKSEMRRRQWLAEGSDECSV